jgi:hypothetical protein
MISPGGSAGKAPQMGWLIPSGVRFANRARQTFSAWPISRGTEGSNPASSSGESANHRFRGGRLEEAGFELLVPLPSRTCAEPVQAGVNA